MQRIAKWGSVLGLTTPSTRELDTSAPELSPFPTMHLSTTINPAYLSQSCPRTCTTSACYHFLSPSVTAALGPANPLTFFSSLFLLTLVHTWLSSWDNLSSWRSYSPYIPCFLGGIFLISHHHLQAISFLSSANTQLFLTHAIASTTLSLFLCSTHSPFLPFTEPSGSLSIPNLAHS